MFGGESPYVTSAEMARRRMEREGVVLAATNTLMASWPRIGAAPKAGSCSTFSFRRSAKYRPRDPSALQPFVPVGGRVFSVGVRTMTAPLA